MKLFHLLVSTITNTQLLNYQENVKKLKQVFCKMQTKTSLLLERVAILQHNSKTRGPFFWSQRLHGSWLVL